MATSAEWSSGYAHQAEADFNTFQWFESLAHPEHRSVPPDCHKLQFLQMSCEKLVKAHLCGEGSDPKSLQVSHAFVAGTLPVVLRRTARELGVEPKRLRWLLRQVRHLALEIELLAPAVKRGGSRPDNCEYPWEDEAGSLHLPLDWSFATAQLLTAPAGRTFLKLIQAAVQQLLV